mgnify:CR=1 FL=1
MSMREERHSEALGDLGSSPVKPALILAGVFVGMGLLLCGGVAGYIAWTEPEAPVAFLVLDRNGNGRADNGLELFGNYTAQPDGVSRNGFRALAVLDAKENGGNEDGVIDSSDRQFESLRLWVDANHDGVCDLSELRTLRDAGLAAISLAYKREAKKDRHGNLFAYRARVLTSDHRTRWAWDVYCATERR